MSYPPMVCQSCFNNVSANRVWSPSWFLASYGPIFICEKCVNNYKGQEFVFNSEAIEKFKQCLCLSDPYSNPHSNLSKKILESSDYIILKGANILNYNSRILVKNSRSNQFLLVSAMHVVNFYQDKFWIERIQWC